jgi:hypothetical protein
MKTWNKKKLTRTLGSRSFGLGVTLVASGAVLAPGCKFESCADTNSCEPGTEESLGGQGGVGGMEDPDNTPSGTGGDDMVEGMGGEGASPSSTGGAGASPSSTGGDAPVLACADDEVACDGECVDPATDAGFCGARGACEGDDAGTVCDEGEICVQGACGLDCLEGEFACGGSCIDPQTNDD